MRPRGSRRGRGRRPGTARRAGAPAGPVARSTGSAALTTASRTGVRVAGRRAAASQRLGARRLAGGRAGRSRLARAARPPCAVGVDDLGHDALGRDADDQRDTDVGGQRVVGADAAPRPGGALAGVGDQAGLGRAGGRSPRRSAWRCRSSAASSARVSRRCVHQRAQHVLVGQRAEQLQRRLGGVTADAVLVRSSCLEGPAPRYSSSVRSPN